MAVLMISLVNDSDTSGSMLLLIINSDPSGPPSGAVSRPLTPPSHLALGPRRLVRNGSLMPRGKPSASVLISLFEIPVASLCMKLHPPGGFGHTDLFPVFGLVSPSTFPK